MSDEKIQTVESFPKETSKGRCHFIIYSYKIVKCVILYNQEKRSLTCTCVLGKKDQLVTLEMAQEGSVTWRTYHQYCKAAGGIMSCCFSVFSNHFL